MQPLSNVSLQLTSDLWKRLRRNGDTSLAVELGRYTATRLSMIPELLEAHYKRPYPAGSHDPVADVDLEMLDADVVGLASHYLDHRALSDHQLPIMRGCVDDAERVLLLLEGEAWIYFARVRDLAAAVLADIDRAHAV